MFKKFIALSSLILVSACAAKPKIDHPEYWQRTDAPSQIYLRGAKAQHSLNHDIANCAVEIRELARLGSLRNATPPNTAVKRSDGAPTSGRIAGFDTPAYDSSEYAAYYDYNDFEGCMYDKGWQRVAFVPADVEEEARRNFIDAIFTPAERQVHYNSVYYGDAYSTDAVEYDNLNE